MLKKSRQGLGAFYKLFTSGLNRAEIERLVKVDARDMYAYFRRGVENTDAEQNAGRRFVIFMKNLFTTFLLKLSPARRLLYGISFILFILAFINSNWNFAVYAFILVNFLLALELADKLIAKDELAVARDIQLSLLPDANTSITGYASAAFCDAARNVGGDYYDFIPLKDGSTLVAIADVSGKGMPAALYMVKVQSLLRLFADETSDPKELLARLEKNLSRELQRHYFLTISLLKVAPNGKVQYCRAGHSPAILYNSSEKTCRLLEPKGSAIGLFPSANSDRAATRTNGKSNMSADNRFVENLEIAEYTFAKGDTIFLYTDGVTETFNSKKEEFGEERLEEIIRANHANPPGEIKQHVLDELAKFRAGSELFDDTTFVVLKY